MIHMRRRARAPAAVTAALLLVVSSGCQAIFGQARLTEKEAYDIMDTDVSIKACGRKASVAIDKAIDEMRRLDRMLSSYDPNSEISEVNRLGGIKPVKVSPETYQVMERALYFATISNGAFDPTILPVMRLWGFGDPKQHVPSKEEIARALELVDYRKVQLSQQDSTVFVGERGMGVDLGAIAKGYAVDRMADIMRKEGVTSFLINAGGNVYASGLKPDRTPWNVAVTDPRDPPEFLGIMKARDISIVSSGDYERSFEEGGQRYHHIIDPNTGYPSRTSRGTAVFLPSSTDADGLSTTLFILGPDSSPDVLSKFPGVGAIFVLPDGTIATRGIVDNFEFK
jgi:thiamine biosynthesis lipoprotein